MKKRRLFGENISPDCAYCQNSLFNGETYICCVKREIRDGKCRKFNYNPTLRVPMRRIELSAFTVEDFKL